MAGRRRSVKNDLNEEQVSAINEAFALFDANKTGKMACKDLKVSIILYIIYGAVSSTALVGLLLEIISADRPTAIKANINIVQYISDFLFILMYLCLFMFTYRS